MTSRRLLTIVLVIALTIATAIFFTDANHTGGSARGRDNLTPLLAPYALAESASTNHYDPKGQLDYAFTAEKLQYFRLDLEKLKNLGLPTNKMPNESEYTLVKNPKITVFHSDTPWHIEALHGRLSQEKRVIHLSGDVVIRRGASTEKKGVNQELILQTQTLTIRPEEKVAFSDEAVTILSSAGKLTATGMRAYFAEQRIELLSKVRGEHEPIQ